MNRSPLKTLAAAACAAALALTVVGCGGDDKDKPGANPSTTLDPVRAGYASLVEPICDKAYQDLQAISAAFGDKVPTAAEFSASLEQAGDLVLAEVAEIRKVEVPTELAERVEGWLSALEKAGKKMPKLTKADAEKGVDVFVDSDPRATDLGLRKCTSSQQ